MTIGGYRFSESDAQRTLLHALDLLDLYPPQAIALQGPRRARILEALADVERSSGDTTESVLSRVWPELLGARDELVPSGSLPSRGEGVVARVSASDGGVPKQAVDSADVGLGGLNGDRQRTRKHHGRPWQALCLWSSEVISDLAAEGHPIGPGSAGENVTISGLRWADVIPGVQLRIGTVHCQVSAFALPCAQNARWFSDRDFTRIHHSRGPISRVYATVLEPGTVTTGDAVVLEP